MPRFEHIRHKPPTQLAGPRELLLVSCPLRSNVNLSRLVRLAGCSGIAQIVHCGAGKVDREIARDAADSVTITSPRSLPPVLDRLRAEGYRCVGLEQTTNSQLLYDYQFVRKTALVIGSEREGLPQEILDRLDVSRNSSLRSAREFQCGDSHHDGRLRILSTVSKRLSSSV